MTAHYRISAADGTMLSVTQWGALPSTIVLIHGFADGKYLWSPFSTALMQHAGVMAMDLRGHGDSEWDADSVYSIAKLVSDGQAVINACCAHDLLLVGHSLGAHIALQLAAVNPQRVRGLVLVDAGPGMPADGISQVRSNFRSRTGPFASPFDYQRAFSGWMPLADSDMLALSADNALTKSGEAYRLKCDPRIVDMEFPQASDEQWSLLQSPKCPILLIRGQASAVLSRQTAAEMTRRLPSLRCETVPMAGHAIMMDNPEAFLSILQKFVFGVCSSIGASESSDRSSAIP
jgi:pimeloyl-ACP methyl ester carboxylesterase